MKVVLLTFALALVLAMGCTTPPPETPTPTPVPSPKLTAVAVRRLALLHYGTLKRGNKDLCLNTPSKFQEQYETRFVEKPWPGSSTGGYWIRRIGGCYFIIDDRWGNTYFTTEWTEGK